MHNIDSKLKNKIQKILKTRKQGVEFLFFNVAGNSFTLLLNFILPFAISADTYGHFALVFAIFNFCAAIFTFGLDSTIIKFSIEKPHSAHVLKTSILAWSLLTLSGLFILGIFSLIVTRLDLLAITLPSLLIVILASAFISLQRILLSYYVGIEKRKSYGGLFILNKSMQFVLILTAALYCEHKLFPKVLPYLLLIQSLLVFIYIILKEKNNLIINQPKKTEVFELIRFTLPLSLNTIGGIGYSYGFNIFISPFLSLTQLGILNIFTQFSSIASMTINALNNGYIPRFYRSFLERPKQAVINYFRYIAINAVPILFLVLVVGIFYKYLSYKAIDDYNLLVLSIYCFGLLLYSFKAIGSGILIMKGKTMTISLTTVGTSIINILAAILFTSHFAFIGCIVSLSGGYIFQVLAFNFDSLKVFFQSKHV